MDAYTPEMEAFAALLPTLCDLDTGSDRENWTQENPLWGHCAVASLVAQDRFGGDLMRASLEPFPKYAAMRSHYWNRLPDGSERDLTRPQFGDDPPAITIAETRTRTYVLSHAATMERYKLLAWRLACAENPGNALFESDVYRRCYTAAMGSPCQKMRFGALLMRQGAYVSTMCNATIEPLKSLCEPKCIRLGIQSRTESMIGACGHAEEHVLWDAVRNGIKLSDCDLYVAGVQMNGRPWLKDRAEHTCLRCAVQMHNAGILRVFVPVGDRWESVTTAEALEQAKAYATKQKSV